MLNTAAVSSMAQWWLPNHLAQVCWTAPRNINSSHTAGTTTITTILANNNNGPPSCSRNLASISSDCNPKSRICCSTTIWIYRIEVVEGHKFKGIGQKLLEFVEEYANLNNIKYVEGIFYPTNEYAETFYLKNGYKICKEGYETIVSKYITLNKENKSKNQKNYIEEK